MKLKTKVGGLAAAGLLVFALAGTASADIVWAQVTDHMASDSASNNPDWWEAGGGGGFDFTECTKLDEPGVSTYLLDKDYALVVVKAGSAESSGDNSLTLFADASAGETVWADSNGSDAFDQGDKQISHIIFCDGSESSSTTTTTDTTTTTTDTTTTDTTTNTTTTDTTTTDTTTNTTTTTTDTFSQSLSSESTSITQPPTDTIGAGGSGNQATGMWLLVAALGVLLGSLVVVAPARAKNKR